MKRPQIPAAVARQLRQEAGFGCAECGNPIVEYHHIVPYSERQHFEVEHMVALCPTCHTTLGARMRKHAYRAKQNPYNLRTGRLKGFLYTKRENQAIRIGNIRIDKIRRAISYRGIPIVEQFIEDEEIRVNVFIPNKDFWPDLEIFENSISAQTSKYWDIEFKENWVKFRKKKGEVFLSIDFRGNDACLNASLEIEGRKYRFSDSKSEINGSIFHNFLTLTSQGATSGLEFPELSAIELHGNSRRFLRPNYAMRVPCLCPTDDRVAALFRFPS